MADHQEQNANPESASAMGQCNNKDALRTVGSTSEQAQNSAEGKGTKSMADKVIISCSELKKMLDDGVETLRIMDVSSGEEEAYKSAHIPGALFMDLFHKVENTDYIMRNIPTAEVFEAYVKTLSISPDSQVVIYDKADHGGGYMSAGRGWFLFKYFGHENVCILDGGLAKWKEAEYETNSEIPKPEEGSFKASVKSDLMKTFDEMVENLEKQDFQVCDTRPAAAYNQGHIASAVNIPLSGKLVDPDAKKFRTIEQLKEAFEASDIDATKPLVASCMGGLTSCSLMVAAALLGKKDVALYLGSWHEWNQRASGSQIEKS